MRKSDYPSPEFLRQAFRYEDGKLFWRERPLGHFRDLHTMQAWNGRWSGKEAGYANEALHFGTRWMIGITRPGEKWILTYRSIIVWYLFNDEVLGEDMEIDHKDRDKLNDRIENLRASERKHGTYNTSIRKNKKSELPKGVSICSRTGKYKSQIQIDGFHPYLGSFDTVEEAQKAYLDAAEKYFGEFATSGEKVPDQVFHKQFYDKFEDVPLPVVEGVEFRRSLVEGWCSGDNGTVLSCLRNRGRDKSRQGFTGKWRELKLKEHNQNIYPCLSYIDKSTGKKTSVQAYKVIFESFNGPVPEGMMIRHKNDIRTDSRLSNLCLGTKTDNMIDAVKNGRIGRGDTHSRVKMTGVQVLEARELSKNGASVASIYRMFKEKYKINISYTGFFQAVNSSTWKHLE